jgi:hypothetical protein
MAPPLRGFLLLSILALAFVACPARAAVKGKDIFPERELLITAPSVVDSPTAQYPEAWSFGGLIERLVGKDDAPGCVREWLETWTKKQKVNSHDVAPRPAIVEKLIAPWQKRDGYDPKSDKPWEPKLAHAPFRLLAIVNRIDLCAPAVAGSMKEVQDSWKAHGREKEFNKLMLGAAGQATTVGGYGFSGGPGGNVRQGTPKQGGVIEIQISEARSAGEGRLVFGAVDDAGQPLEGGFTVIFEYLLTASNTADVREWANRWHELGNYDVANHGYAVALEKLTRSFTHAKETQLGQLRTSEACFGKGREFRQFSFSSGFTPAELSQTPAALFNGEPSPEKRALAEFLHQQDPLIRSGIHQLPSSVPSRRSSVAVLGGSAIIPANSPGYYWDPGPTVSRDARRTFSLNTCTGCHGGETACADGLHIHPRAAGAEAVLSTFLNRDRTPLRLNDPDTKGVKVQYEEMSDRASILAALLESRDRPTVVALHPILRARLARTH